MKPRLLGILILGFLLLPLIGLSASMGKQTISEMQQHVQQQGALSDYPSELAIRIFQIDPSRLAATIQITAFVYSTQPAPNNTNLEVTGSSIAFIPLRLKTNFTIYQTGQNIYEYNATSETILWWMRGEGAVYPFDNYTLNFQLSPLYNPFLNKTGNLELGGQTWAHFDGNAVLSLLSNWRVLNNDNLAVQSSIVQDSLTVVLARQPTAAVPITIAVLSSYALVGFSFVLKSPKHLSARLSVYTSIFILMFTLYYGLQNAQPYRPSLSILDLLFLGLIACTAVAGCTAMLGNAYPNNARGFDGGALALDLVIMGSLVTSVGMNRILISEASANNLYPVAFFSLSIALLIIPASVFLLKRHSSNERQREADMESKKEHSGSGDISTNTTGLSFELARGKLEELIREEAVVLRTMMEKGYLGYAPISDQSNQQVLQKKLDHLRGRIAALREYCMIDSLDTLNLESKKLTTLTIGLKRLTLVLAALALIQIIVMLLFR